MHFLSKTSAQTPTSHSAQSPIANNTTYLFQAINCAHCFDILTFYTPALIRIISSLVEKSTSTRPDVTRPNCYVTDARLCHRNISRDICGNSELISLLTKHLRLATRIHHMARFTKTTLAKGGTNVLFTKAICCFWLI